MTDVDSINSSESEYFDVKDAREWVWERWKNWRSKMNI